MKRLLATIKKDRRPPVTITRYAAATEIAQGLNIPHEAAMMMLYGLCATGNVRWTAERGEVVEEDAVTIAAFSGKPAFVVADDLRSFLADCSPDPQPLRRDQVIVALLDEGRVPPRKIAWKAFNNLVRERCNGWLNGRPALGSVTSKSNARSRG
jgi:hypothetical protein